MKKLYACFMILLFSLFFGCDYFLDEIGGENEPCSDKSTCQDGLTCTDGICMKQDGQGNEGQDCDILCPDRCGDFLDCDCGDCPEGEHCSSNTCVSDDPCETDENCGEKECFEQMECMFPEDPCSEEGIMETVCRIPQCQEGRCEMIEQPSQEACFRLTDGEPCRIDQSDIPGVCRDSQCHAEIPNNIWFDGEHGLLWQRFSEEKDFTWEQAKRHCNELDLGGFEWRMPSINELRFLIRDCPSTEFGGYCQVSDDCSGLECLTNDIGIACGGCDASRGPADGCYWDPAISGPCASYWSDTAFLDNIVTPEDEIDKNHWRVDFNTAAIIHEPSTTPAMIRCVRFFD